MFKIVLCWVTICIVSAAPDMSYKELQAAFVEIFGEPPKNTEAPTITSSCTNCTTGEGKAGICVADHLCGQGYSRNIFGVGVIDARFSYGQCPSYLEICCTINNIRETQNPISPLPSSVNKLCSYHKGVRILCCMDNATTTSVPPSAATATTVRPPTTTIQPIVTTIPTVQEALTTSLPARLPEVTAAQEPAGSVTTIGHPPAATTSAPRPASTTESEDYEYVEVHPTPAQHTDCDPLPGNLTAPPGKGRTAWEKCLEYQEKVLYPCTNSTTLTGKRIRSNHCKHNPYIDGNPAKQDEFPHMVLIGSGEDIAFIEWSTFGVLISERFVLTGNRMTRLMKYVRTGALRKSDAADPARVYRVKQVIIHPDYEWSTPYAFNNLALVETEKDIIFDQSAVPACLDVRLPNNYEQALGTGWGFSDAVGTFDHLQKVTMNRIPMEKCMEYQHRENQIPGFNVRFTENKHMCYTGQTWDQNICHGEVDSGPLQIKHKQIECMYTVIGIEQHVRYCGRDSPSVYTRVAPHVPWIQSVVWSAVD